MAIEDRDDVRTGSGSLDSRDLRSSGPPLAVRRLHRPRTLRGPRCLHAARAALFAGLLVAVAAVTCAAAPLASAQSWPAYPDPIDYHETNSAWYPPDDNGGTAVGNAQDWVGNAPTELTNELNVSLGLANYGTTDVFYVDSEQNLVMRPWDFTTVPDAPTSPASGSTLVVPGQSNGVGHLGVCEVGGAAPDVFVFYLKGDPTVAANRTTLFWRQISESWNVEHSVAVPSDFCTGSSWDQVPGAGKTYFLRGRVVALSNAFAFVFKNANGAEVDVYVSNLLQPGADGAVGKSTAWRPTTSTSPQVRDVDAIPFAYQGSTYLAVGALYGSPSTDPPDFPESQWGTLITRWDDVQAGVRVYSVGDDGSCTADTSTSFAVPACPDPGPSMNGSGLVAQSGALNIRLLRGGVTNGPRGDVLTVMTRTFGTLNRWLVNDHTHGVTMHYDTIQPELLDVFEVTIDHSQSVPVLGSSPQRYSAWQRRGLMCDTDMNDLEAANVVYELVDAEGLVQRNFFATTLAVDDPDGPTNPSGITPSPSPSASATPLVYDSSRQRIVCATATKLHAQGMKTKNGKDTNNYTGVVGAVVSLDSDALQPVKTDTTDENGDPLATPISYPYPLPPDSSDLQLIGIMYGTPPTYLNGNAQSAVFPLGSGTNYFSSVLFGQSSTAGTTTIDTTDGGAGFSMSAEGEGKHGLKLPFEPELSWTTDREDTTSNQLTVANSETFWPGPTQTPTGTALFKQISSFQLQRFTRLDWDEGEIGDGVSESVFVVNPLPDSPNGLVPKSFSLTDPGSDPMFTGMASRFDTLSPKDWLGVDPLGQARQGDHGDLFDTSGAGTQMTLSHTAGGGPSTLSFTQSQATQDDVISNGVSAKLRIPFFSGDYSYSHQVVDQTTTTAKTVASLGLPQPPQGQEAGSVQSITLTAYWLRAKDADAYWIPDAFRTGGNYQTPWCIDYQVMSYGLAPDASAGSAASPQCRIAVRCSPSSGGRASVLNGTRAAGGVMLGTVDSNGALISASPAPGYRFKGWKLAGSSIARLIDGKKRNARVVAKGHGGVTATARFERIVPTSVSITRLKDSTCNVAVKNAPLPEPFRHLKPYLNNSATARAHELTLLIENSSYRVPAWAWRKRGRGDRVKYVASWRPQGWGRKARVKLTIDPRGTRWSVTLQRGSVTRSILGAAAGHLPMALQGTEAPQHVHLPVTCTAKFKAAAIKPAGTARSVKAAGSPAVDLRTATISTVVDAKQPGKARFTLTGVRVQRSLLKRAGFDLKINQTILHVGPFTRKGGTFTATGRVPHGIHVICRYTSSGAFTLKLGGGDLERHLLGEFLVQNLTLTIGSGKNAPSGTMVPQAVKITHARVAPRLASLLE
jgi:hypothetical protein